MNKNLTIDKILDINTSIRFKHIHLGTEHDLKPCPELVLGGPFSA